ncbi:MAG TPA: peptidyl-prolyl cis-trans isomerase [Gemmatimonadales bacterium]
MLQSMRSAAKYVWILLIIFFVGGFLLLDTSGLLGTGGVTTGTTVAEVNGEAISYQQWQLAAQSLAQQEEARLGRALTLDERQQVENEAFEQMVNEILLRQELERRGIGVTDDELRAAAQFPPPALAQSPELQTDGRFDPEKYRRFLASPAAKEQGLLVQLEQYYRQEIPRQKLFSQIASDAYLTDAQLWRIWQDRNDSAQVSFVAFPADSVADSAVTVSDAEIRAFYDRHRDDFVRPGRAVVSLLRIPRTLTAADTAASRERAVALRNEILGGASFADVARRESADPGSAEQGGSLGRGTLEQMSFVEPFEAAARDLPAGQVSEPVLTQFGYHLIRVDERQGDTLALSHILVSIQQSDSSAARTDRLADSVARIAANSDRPARFDSAAKAVGVPVTRGEVTEGNVLVVDGNVVPEVAGWAFGGALVGETSDIFTADDAYYMARLDTLVHGGKQPLDAMRDDIRQLLVREKKVEQQMPKARALAQAAAGGSLEAAAQAQGVPVRQTGMFTRASGAPELGAADRAVGAAFALPVGAVSAPIPTQGAAMVIRVDRRVEADSAAWAAQKEMQRAQITPALREQRVRQFLTNLRAAADVDDRRAAVRAAGRRVDG